MSVDELVRDPDEAEGTAEAEGQPRLGYGPGLIRNARRPPEFAGGRQKDQSPSRRLRAAGSANGERESRKACTISSRG